MFEHFLCDIRERALTFYGARAFENIFLLARAQIKAQPSLGEALV
jgi:hypothetical protein